MNNNFHTLYCTHIPRRPCYLVGDCITECQHCSSVKQTTINISEDSSVQRGYFSGTCNICDVPKLLRWRHCVYLAMTQFELLLKKSTLPESETMRWQKKALKFRVWIPAFQSRASQCNCASLHPCNLSTRTERQSGERSNKCNQCDYASSEEGHLRTHIWRRTVEKSHYSDSCCLSQAAFAALKKYIRVWALSCQIPLYLSEIP